MTTHAAPPTSIRRVRILGVPIDLTNRAIIERAVADHLAAGRGLLHVVTVNPEYVMTARRDLAFAQAIADGLVTIDGVGVEKVARLTWPSAPIGRYTGVDLSWYCARHSARTGAGIFLLGSGPGVAEQAGRVMQQRHPGCVISGSWADGSPRPEDDAASLDRIRQSGARILLVAYGAPSQVTWIQRNRPALDDAGIMVVSGIGGALDYISGAVRYAPPIVRRLGLEWLVRLVREPWRWRRQLVLPAFAALALTEAAARRIRSAMT